LNLLLGPLAELMAHPDKLTAFFEEECAVASMPSTTLDMLLDSRAFDRFELAQSALDNANGKDVEICMDKDEATPSFLRCALLHF
jgi:hypothetical protein